MWGRKRIKFIDIRKLTENQIIEVCKVFVKRILDVGFLESVRVKIIKITKTLMEEDRCVTPKGDCYQKQL